MMLPLASTATPVGALNWPLPSPWDPNLNRNSPSALYTWGQEVESEQEIESEQEVESDQELDSGSLCQMFLYYI